MREHNWLAAVEEGMDVYDVEGDKVGSVKSVFLGTHSTEVEAHEQEGSGEPDPDLDHDQTWAEATFDLLGGISDMPEEVRQRLQQHGYIQIDESGFFAGNRFVLAEHIVGVTEEGVRLSVNGDDLIS